jgi:hypothetical protein
MRLRAEQRKQKEGYKQEPDHNKGKKVTWARVLLALSIVVAVGVFFTSITIIRTYWALVSLGYLLSWLFAFFYGRSTDKADFKRAIASQDQIISGLAYLITQYEDVIDQLKKEKQQPQQCEQQEMLI